MKAEIAWALKRTVAPVLEPVSLDEAKRQCRVTHDHEDGLIDGYRQTAREFVEQGCRRGLLTQTWRYTLDEWLDEIVLPMAAPLQSVTTVKYYDTNGAQQTLATSYYTVDTNAEPGRIYRAADQSWPSVQSDRAQPIEITYVVGHTDADAVPVSLKQAVLMLTEHFYLHRGPVIVNVGNVTEVPIGTEALMAFYRVYWTPPVCA